MKNIQILICNITDYHFPYRHQEERHRTPHPSLARDSIYQATPHCHNLKKLVEKNQPIGLLIL